MPAKTRASLTSKTACEKLGKARHTPGTLSESIRKAVLSPKRSASTRAADLAYFPTSHRASPAPGWCRFPQRSIPFGVVLGESVFASDVDADARQGSISSAPSNHGHSEMTVPRVGSVNPACLACRNDLNRDGLRHIGGAFISNDVHVVAARVNKSHAH